ncbi:type II secretion system GspH family protein [Candidatus Gracilibacteria bacterium]|nr:type II secretion system GspH family protein [Candidatus Gracilibacteria bacterium]MCF7898989.1 type II secretion system GspH family protein [Candidatus Paceibacterota bacterium]
MKLFLKQAKSKSVRAFTLLEVLASLAIITMVILGPFSLAVNSSSYARQTRDIITSTYLAEEAVELLQYQHSSLYISCLNRVDLCADDVPDTPPKPNETESEKAWRLFKTRLSTHPNTSCFDSGGCSYDFIDMLNATSTAIPSVYSPTDSDCRNIAQVSSIVDSAVREYYVCSGIDTGRLKDAFYSVARKTYTRRVTVESLPTFETGGIVGTPNLGLYNDDLLVTAYVTYTRSNGIVRTIKVAHFLHKHS